MKNLRLLILSMRACLSCSFLWFARMALLSSGDGDGVIVGVMVIVCQDGVGVISTVVERVDVTV